MLLGGAISVACILLLLRTVDLSRTMAAFGRADPTWLLLSLIFIAGALLMRFWKWQLLFLPQDRIGFGGAFSATMVGYFFNALLPGRVGELARTALIARSDHVSPARAFGTIVVEKILDVLALLLILGLLTTLIALPEWATRTGLVATAAFGSLAIVFFAMSRWRGPVVAWGARTLDPLPVLRRLRPSRLLELLLSAADSLRYPRLLALQLALSALLWGCALLTVLAIINAFHLGTPWTAAALVVVATNLGMTVPAAPASVGVYHGAAVVALRVFGVDESTALAVAIVIHAMGFGALVALGAAVLLEGIVRRRYRIDDLWRWHQRETGFRPNPHTAR